MRETMLLTIVGIGAGILITLATRRAITQVRPVQQMFWSTSWMLRVTLIALVGAMAGALYPAVKAAQRDPIDALAYE
jgi:putative ABC transport system permease protein